MKPEPLTDDEIRNVLAPHTLMLNGVRAIEAEVNARWEAMPSKQEPLEVTDELLENLIEQFEPEIPPVHDDLHVAYAAGKKEAEALLRQALEALEYVIARNYEFASTAEPIGNAITAIRENLK